MPVGRWFWSCSQFICGALFSLPNLFSEKFVYSSIPDWLPNGQLVLGLDLQGGAHILLQVEEAGVIEERLEVLRGDVRSLLREDRIGYTGLAVRDGGRSGAPSRCHTG